MSLIRMTQIIALVLVSLTLFNASIAGASSLSSDTTLTCSLVRFEGNSHDARNPILIQKITTPIQRTNFDQGSGRDFLAQIRITDPVTATTFTAELDRDQKLTLTEIGTPSRVTTLQLQPNSLASDSATISTEIWFNGKVFQVNWDAYHTHERQIWAVRFDCTVTQ